MIFISGLSFPSYAQNQGVVGKSGANCTATVIIFYYNSNTGVISTSPSQSVAPFQSFTIYAPTNADKVYLLTADMNGDGSMEIKIPANNPNIPTSVIDCYGNPFTYPDPCYTNASVSSNPSGDRWIFGFW